MHVPEDLVVVGSANADITVRVERPPIRGETVAGGDAVEGPGGKGLNQAVAAARLGRHVGLVGAVGDDAAGRMLRAVLAATGVTDRLETVGRPTGRALVLVDAAGDSTITVSLGANALVDADLVHRHADHVAGARAVLLQHEVSEDAVRAATTIASGLVVLNPAPARTVPADVLGRIQVLVPNASELASLTGSASVPRDPTSAAHLAGRLDTSATVVVTLGSEGAVVVHPGSDPVRVAAPRVDVVDATAAGDTFCAAMVDALLDGGDVVEATRWAVSVAAVTVTRAGAAESVPRRDEVPAR